MSEIPIYVIWLVGLCAGFCVGVGVGYLLQLSLAWREVWKLRHDNEVLRLKLDEVEKCVDRHKRPPAISDRGLSEDLLVPGRR